MQDHEPKDDDGEPGDGRSAENAERMLRAVLSGATYDAVAARHGMTRTAVERRIKALATRAVAGVGIEGLNEEGAGFVRRLRMHREAVLAALGALQEVNECSPVPPREIRVLTEDEVNAGARRIRARSNQPLEDLALYYLLFATGARPLEIARLQVFDYLAPDGTVRQASELRTEVAITGRARPACRSASANARRSGRCSLGACRHWTNLQTIWSSRGPCACHAR